MQIIEYLKSLNPGLVTIILVSLVLLLQVIQILLLRKIKKPEDAKSGEDLKDFITSEMDRLKQEMISFETRAPSELKKDLEHLTPEETAKQEEKIAEIQPEQLEENIPFPGPGKTDYPSEFTYEEMELKPVDEEIDSMGFVSGEDDPGGSDLQTCIDQYNDAVPNEDMQNRFLDTYRPLRVDVVNALERRRRADLPPAYQTADNGDYYVVELLDMGRTAYVVLPRFDLMIKDSNYKAGAFGEVFDCPDYEQAYRYRVNRVVKPAFFEKRRDEYWELSSKGRIMLSLE